METFISKCETDTLEFAKKFAKTLKKDDVIVLDGELGAGKTKFTQGILEFFGLSDEISSPTFTIVNEYRNDRANIFHFDVYRLSSEDEFFAIGGEEYFGKGICIIEWGKIIRDALPPNCIFVSFEKDLDDVNLRKILIER
ncbi:MAG: tRNA (adenosine(37)-N6)-threonylcarbamoyltransferase complex ATPase subunit type 1 TsaE [Clostridia bacterium]|nr:tRNA (adenosine(37)-N6)-threonylcarbamoyltransferase complex ATPase subunit type 1 TsaE [Clostridia bacterium]